MTANIGHYIDRGRAANDLAPHRLDYPVVGEGFRFAIHWTCFKQDYPVVHIFGQTIRQDTTGAARTDN